MWKSKCNKHKTFSLTIGQFFWIMVSLRDGLRVSGGLIALTPLKNPLLKGILKTAGFSVA
jgi:hypothetical protein